jgi:hypothetical protein
MITTYQRQKIHSQGGGVINMKKSIFACSMSFEEKQKMFDDKIAELRKRKMIRTCDNNNIPIEKYLFARNEKKTVISR